MPTPERRSVDLSAYPDLVVIYLGYRADKPRGVISLLRIGLGLLRIRKVPPDGLLNHEFMLFGPFHVGFRQYWRDFASLEAFTRASQHAFWWKVYVKDTRGGGVWHETYCKSGGMEAMYLNMPKIGLGGFAPQMDPVGPRRTSARRLERMSSVGDETPDSAPGEPSQARPKPPFVES